MKLNSVIRLSLLALAPLWLGTSLVLAEMHGHKHGHEMGEKKMEKMTKELNLTAEQQSAIEAAQKEKMEKMKAAHDEYDAKVMGVLNDEQKKKYSEWKEKRKERMEDRRENRKEHRKERKEKSQP
jgi:periplasmic protein CpxP/Spy